VNSIVLKKIESEKVTPATSVVRAFDQSAGTSN